MKELPKSCSIFPLLLVKIRVKDRDKGWSRRKAEKKQVSCKAQHSSMSWSFGYLPIVDVSLQLCVSRPASLPEAVRGKSLAGSFSCERVRAKHRYALFRRCGLLSRTYQGPANNVLIVRRRTRPRHLTYEYDMDKTRYADPVPNEGLAVVSVSVLRNAPISTRSCADELGPNLQLFDIVQYLC